MRNFGTPLLIDLLSGGAPSVSVTPGAGLVPITFTTGALKQQVGLDNWPVCAGIMTCTRLTFDQAAAGGTAVAWDDLFRCIDSFNVSIPGIGTTHAQAAFTGPAAKHIVEFQSARYRYVDHARAIIPSTDGDTTIDLYVNLPFANENYIEPRDFMPWVGWLLALQVTVNVATATTIAAVSTGAVTKAPGTVRAWLEAYIAPEPKIPLFSQWNKYSQAAAAGATAVVLQNVGQANGLNSVLQGCRLAALIEGMNKAGIGGTSTADVYTGYSSPDLGQDQTVNVDAIFASFLRQIGHRGPISGAIAANPLHDGGGNPYTMAGTPSNLLNDVSALYIPWRFSGTEQKVTNVPKWKMGNLTVNRTFSATPSTGSYFFWTNEIRMLDKNGIKNLLDAASIPPAVRARISFGLANRAEGSRAGQREVSSLAIPTRGDDK